MNRYEYPQFQRPDIPLRVPQRDERTRLGDCRKSAHELKGHIIKTYSPSKVGDELSENGKLYEAGGWTVDAVAKDLLKQLEGDIKKRGKLFVMVQWPGIIPADAEDGFENYVGTMRIYWGIEYQNEHGMSMYARWGKR